MPVTRELGVHEGLFIYLNMSPITWFSKNQATIESSVFGAEFVAMKQGRRRFAGFASISCE
jgi:hypothetical protein